jgi:Na+/H+ antiporter NhaC
MGWVTILPQIITIAVVLWRKDIIIALLAGAVSSEILIQLALNMDSSGVSIGAGPGIMDTVIRTATTFESANNLRLFAFTILIGALIAYLRHSGGVMGLVNLLINRGLAATKKRAGLLTMVTGIALFIETNLSMLTTGLMSRGLYDKFGMSRERLAYIVDVTCAPVSILFIVINGWGAYVRETLTTSGLDNPVEAIIGSLLYNFYPWLALLIALYTIISDKVHGPMKAYERAMGDPQKQNPNQEQNPGKNNETGTRQAGTDGTSSGGTGISRTGNASDNASGHISEQVMHDFDGETLIEGKARNMLIPITILVSGIFFVLYQTGGGTLSNGNSSEAILYSTIVATIAAYILTFRAGRDSHSALIKIGIGGMKKLFEVTIILILAFIFGASLKTLGTGDYVATFIGDNIPLIMVVPIIFLAASFVSFSTGTSYGTMAIFIPIGVPIILGLGLPAEFVLSAILGGAVFGDHCSPISDTTVLSSVASGSDVLSHVKTQLPYALAGGTGAFILYFITGFFIL